MCRRLRVLKALILLTGAAMLGAADAPRDWSATLLTDAQAFHDQVVEDHPGPYNRLDPGFSASNDRALALALTRARQVRDYPGYLWAMRGYVAHFNDGHVAFDVQKPEPIALEWPGFLTGFDGAGRQVVRTVAEGAGLPPVGAVLEQCDGIAAETLAARNVGAFRGRWQLASQRATQGGRLFIDARNPFITRPSRCTFRVNGRRQQVTLAWRPLPDAEFDTRFAATAPRARPAIGAHVLADGTRWYAMSNFDGNPEGATAKALRPMIADLTRDRDQVVAAPRIVLDLRGNGGGSSEWSQQIARVIWGRAAVDKAAVSSEAVEWRASASNLATLQGYKAEWQASPNGSPEAIAWAGKIVDGMARARARGEPLWRDDSDETKNEPVTPAAVAPPTARVFVLTDWGCGSACLDAVDLWTALGAVQVGQDTSADTLYMDVREKPLPSGIGEAVIPMKVYRDRKRASNQPAIPHYRFTGDMRDDAALESWIAGLPRT
ncbi:S41 family peptidase [Sphingomonas sp. Mn802worker]|uniref:S41 family peptidase n=1 Tax=Sphingomonas sp. Mn802worker TaxID=629773 RepID=UPI0003A53025|nr:S41 family peptidase [Sphingomonas sp. Mn802worker]